MTGSTSGRSAAVRLDGSSGLPPASLGNKGYGIDLMRRVGLPVPPAFCLTTDACTQFHAGDSNVLERVWPTVLDSLTWLEGELSRTFGTGPRPLLVSVRSGATLSMPGMLDTVLNLGVNDAVTQAIAASSTARFADDVRSRFDHAYRRIVLSSDAADPVIPDDPFVQLRCAIAAVFDSWNSARAVAYRRHHGMGDSGGTAVVVQAMVFGNLGRDSGAGVLFSRNPSTGADEPFGEWLPDAQGEDVVSGTANCLPIEQLRIDQPGVFAELTEAARTLERLAGDAQDIEFTVEEGRLWLLQTRVAKRSARAAVRLALRFRDMGLIDDAEALRRVTPGQLTALLRPSLPPESRAAATLLANGLPASPGVATGIAYLDVDDAIDAADAGKDVILVRPTTSPDDVAGMLAARAIVTDIGGATSHAAVVSRDLGRPAVVGCGAGVAAALEGKTITVDGDEGEIREGALELAAWSEARNPELSRLAQIASRVSPLRAHASGTFPRVDGASEAAIRAALDAGLTDVVSDSPLSTMLTAVRLADV